MTALEIRIIAYAIAFLAVVGGSAYLGHRLTAIHYEALIARDKQAQSDALVAAQQKAISDLQHQAEATATVEKQYDDLKVTNNDLARRFADSLRRYAEIHSGTLSQASPSSPSDGATPGTPGDPELARLSQQTVKSCLNDAAELTALQHWVGEVAK